MTLSGFCFCSAESISVCLRGRRLAGCLLSAVSAVVPWPWHVTYTHTHAGPVCQPVPYSLETPLQLAATALITFNARIL